MIERVASATDELLGFLAAAKSAISHWTEKKQQSGESSKIDIPSVIDVNKNKNKHVYRREVNCKVHYFHFFHRRKPNVPSSLLVRKTNVNKQRLFLSLSKDFVFAVSADDREVIAASLNRQFHDFSDFADVTDGSLDRPWFVSPKRHLDRFGCFCQYF